MQLQYSHKKDMRTRNDPLKNIESLWNSTKSHKRQLKMQNIHHVPEWERYYFCICN